MLNREPTVIIGALSEVIKAVIPLGLIFGYIHWSDSQIGEVILFIGILVGAAEKIFIRSQVAPKQDIVTALNMPKGSTVADLKSTVEKQNE